MIKKILKFILFSVIAILVISALHVSKIIPEWLISIIAFLCGFYITQETIFKMK